MSGVFPLTLPEGLRRRGPGRIRPTLDRLEEALARLGNPERTFRSILLVGTNGKGSTAAMAEAVLAASGLKTGLYTSPHLVRVNERIRVSGRSIADEDLSTIIERLESFPELTFFECLTAAAFLHFAASGVEVAVLEAGMGGRWDATRLAGHAVAGLTNVGSDHQHWLGEDLADRASDKGSALAVAAEGVLGPGVSPAVIPDLGAPGALPTSAHVDFRKRPDGRIETRWGQKDWTLLRPPLAGIHQEDNLHLALALARRELRLGWGRELAPEDAVEGLRHVRWPGRLSEVTLGGRRVLLDAAHNLEGAGALAAELGGRTETFNLLFSCLDDKPVEVMARELGPVVGDVVVFPLSDERAMPLSRLSAAFPASRTAAGPKEGLSMLADPVLAAGSLRVVGLMVALADSDAPDGRT